ncbi:hypothetical protein O181_013463 [Austropuccinia psidii MF-1]|uniref:Uncharacterized protein n=1 Tax=Austropuccinia psidii MF-1 TaxID=1389203 RepID=A0A9Q3BYR2_9BASI|nr:hypothetical protein [Austropuccinia psidii MF-1]
MKVTLEPDTRYHERQKENNHHQKKKTEASNSSSSHHKYSSSSSHKKKNFGVQKRDKPHSSLLNKDQKIMGAEKKEEPRRASVPIVVGSIVLRPVSKGLRTSLPIHDANFQARK